MNDKARCPACDVSTTCPACGEYVDHCEGHGEVEDPHGAAILAKHDDECHDDCVIDCGNI